MSHCKAFVLTVYSSQIPDMGAMHFNANENSSTASVEVKSSSVCSSYYLSDNPGGPD